MTNETMPRRHGPHLPGGRTVAAAVIGAAGVAAATGIGAGLETGKIENPFSSTDSSKTQNIGVVPTSMPPGFTVGAEPTASAIPTPEAPALAFPEKYNFGPDNKYFQSYLGGEIWTGVEADRAEKNHIDYTIPITNQSYSINMPQIKEIEITNPQALEKALLIKDKLKSTYAQKNGNITVEDFDQAKAEVDAMSQDAIKTSEKTGIVLAYPPGHQVFDNQFAGMGKYEDGDFVVYELFKPASSSDNLNTIINGKKLIQADIAGLLAYDSLNYLEAQSPSLINQNSSFTQNQFVPLYNRFLTVIPQDAIIVH